MALVEPEKAVTLRHVKKAVAALVEIAEDRNADTRSRVDAARELVSYGVRHPYSEPPAEED